MSCGGGSLIGSHGIRPGRGDTRDMMYLHHLPSFRSRDEKGPWRQSMDSWDSKGRNGLWYTELARNCRRQTRERLPNVSRICTPEFRQSLSLVLRRIRIKFLGSFRSTHRRVCRTIQVDIRDWCRLLSKRLKISGYIFSIGSNSISWIKQRDDWPADRECRTLVDQLYFWTPR